MRIGVFFIGNLQSGGSYQYSLSILDSLKDRKDKVVIFNLSGADFPYGKYKGYFESSSSPKYMSFLKQLGANIYPKLKTRNPTQATGKLIGKPQSTRKSPAVSAKAILKSWSDIFFLRLRVKLNRIDLIIFTFPSHLSFKLKTPYIMPVHDLQHRLNPQFPEVSADGTWEEREYLYSNAIPNVEAILVDSEVGKEDVLRYYPVDEEKVKVLPFIPPNYLQETYTEEELRKIRQKYHLPQRFLFYPANFWPHKNHTMIIQALNRLKTNQGWKIPVVFVGSNPVRFGVFEKVWELVNIYGLEDQVYYLGYVSNEDIGGLYKLAEALVMPTFFGPTNIPYLEAFLLGCPVIGSNIRGITEQIGGAGLLVDPNSPEDLAMAILKIWKDAGLRETLIKRGYDKIKSWNFEKFSVTLNKLIDEIGARRP